MHLLDKGHVAVRITTPLGDVATLRVLGPGDLFGELAVISPAPRNATVVALDATATLAVSGAAIGELRTRHAGIDRLLLEAAVAEVRRLSAQLTEALYLPAPERLLRRLVDLSGFWPGDLIPLTQDDLAGLAGTTRPTTNKILKEAEADGLVELSRGHVRVVDVEQLRLRAR